jgi:putative glutathione S-transferase
MYYFLAGYDGRVSVPVLWDKQTKTIVNNESAEILRMFNKEFNAFCKTGAQQALDFYPQEPQAEIEGLNEWIYP